MNKLAGDLLKKISYIEADIEISKQILFSLPSDQREEIENIIRTIARSKDDIHRLREEIQKYAPEESKIIARIEESVAAFRKIASESTLVSIIALVENNNCTLTCSNGTEINCLVKALDNKGNWTAISLSGELLQFSANEVKEQSSDETIK